MSDLLEKGKLIILFEELASDSDLYFEKATTALADIEREERWKRFERDHFWSKLSEKLCEEAISLTERLILLSGIIAPAVRNAPLTSEADQRDLMTGTKAMRASLLLRRFSSWTTEVLHDEGTILGVQPAGQSDDHPCPPEAARQIFADWKSRIRAILDLVSASHSLGSVGELDVTAPARYRPNTAFVMMSMEKSKPELVDVADTVKQVFSLFDIHAVRADDIEHEDLITSRILNEIKTAEFCFSDLTGERPNVYYEVGYAHALGRRVILFRKAGTSLHFDLAGYNCPEYENLRDLKEKLTKRLIQLTNRQPKDVTSIPALK